MIRILVSGSTGQLGQELHKISTHYSNLSFHFKSRSEFNLLDKSSISKVLEASPSYDYIINTAAYTAVDQAEKDEKTAMSVNADALEVLANFAPSETKIIHISSDYVYHHDPGRALLETDPTKPKGVYAKSKLIGEKNLLKTRPDSIVIRTSWLFSSYGKNFVKTMLALGKKHNHLNIVNDQHGSPTYVEDLAKDIIGIIQHIEAQEDSSKFKGVFNYSNLGMTHWANFAKEIFQQANIACKVNGLSTKAYGAPAPRPLWSLLSKEKIQKTFHLQLRPWQESLSSCLRELGY